MPDKMIIKRFLELAASEKWNQVEMGIIANRTKSWAHYLINGKIHSLRTATRARLMEILNIEDVDYTKRREP